MKKEISLLICMLVASLIVGCNAIRKIESAPAPQVFPTATEHFLFQGNAPMVTPDYPAVLSIAPTIASFFRTHPSVTPSPVATFTIIPESTNTQAPRPQFFTVRVYEDGLNPNWAVQEDTEMEIDLKSASQVYRGYAAISFSPNEESNSTLFLAVPDGAEEVYRRDQAAKLSFWLFSPDTPLYLDQFFITLVGSNRQPYWSAEEKKVADYLSVFPRISLDKLGFDRAIPANAWIMVEIDLAEALTVEPEYLYITGISFKSTAGPNHVLLIDDISLKMLGEPPKRSSLEIAPRVDSE